MSELMQATLQQCFAQAPFTDQQRQVLEERLPGCLRQAAGAVRAPQEPAQRAAEAARWMSPEQIMQKTQNLANQASQALSKIARYREHQANMADQLDQLEAWYVTNKEELRAEISATAHRIDSLEQAYQRSQDQILEYLYEQDGEYAVTSGDEDDEEEDDEELSLADDMSADEDIDYAEEPRCTHGFTCSTEMDTKASRALQSGLDGFTVPVGKRINAGGSRTYVFERQEGADAISGPQFFDPSMAEQTTAPTVRPGGEAAAGRTASRARTRPGALPARVAVPRRGPVDRGSGPSAAGSAEAPAPPRMCRGAPPPHRVRDPLFAASQESTRKGSRTPPRGRGIVQYSPDSEHEEPLGPAAGGSRPEDPEGTRRSSLAALAEQERKHAQQMAASSSSHP